MQTISLLGNHFNGSRTSLHICGFGTFCYCGQIFVCMGTLTPSLQTSALSVIDSTHSGGL